MTWQFWPNASRICKTLLRSSMKFPSVLTHSEMIFGLLWMENFETQEILCKTVFGRGSSSVSLLSWPWLQRLKRHASPQGCASINNYRQVRIYLLLTVPRHDESMFKCYFKWIQPPSSQDQIDRYYNDHVFNIWWVICQTTLRFKDMARQLTSVISNSTCTQLQTAPPQPTLTNHPYNVQKQRNEANRI